MRSRFAPFSMLESLPLAPSACILNLLLGLLSEHRHWNTRDVDVVVVPKSFRLPMNLLQRLFVGIGGEKIRGGAANREVDVGLAAWIKLEDNDMGAFSNQVLVISKTSCMKGSDADIRSPAGIDIRWIVQCSDGRWRAWISEMRKEAGASHSASG